jgi:VIT1/CCC1 family predicted Fe2+/Mn2+ transporter
MNRNQIIGLILAIAGLILGLLWDKSFRYSGVFDVFLGVLSAIGVSMVLKFLPLKRKKK